MTCYRVTFAFTVLRFMYEYTLWEVTPCSLVETHRRFRDTDCISRQGGCKHATSRDMEHSYVAAILARSPKLFHPLKHNCEGM